MTITEKLNSILTSKSAIRDAIITKGGDIDNTTPLDQYSTAIDNLPSGSGASANDVFTGTISGLTAEITGCTVPNGVTKLSNGLFSGQTKLTTVELNQVTEIGQNVFKNCTYLKNIDLSNVNMIENYAFQNCMLLSSADLTNAIRVNSWCFYGCTSLSNVIIGDGMTKIYGQCFGNCSNLIYVEIPNNIKSFDTSAFGIGLNIDKRVINFGNTRTDIPTMSSYNAFSQGSASSVKWFVVPDALYDGWITATNWSHSYYTGHYKKYTDAVAEGIITG